MFICLSVISLGQNTLSPSSRYGALLKNYLNVLKIPDIGVNSLLKGVGVDECGKLPG